MYIGSDINMLHDIMVCLEISTLTEQIYSIIIDLCNNINLGYTGKSILSDIFCGVIEFDICVSMAQYSLTVQNSVLKHHSFHLIYFIFMLLFDI